jgi:hypothetical protein
MSSTKNLDSIVVLDGTNFKQWKAAIMAYAMLNGFWDAFDASNIPSPADPTAITAEDRRDARDWRQMDQKGMGLIRSKVNPSIRAVFDTSFTIPAATATGPASSASAPSASVAFSAAHRQKNTAAVTPTAANMMAYLEANYGTPGIITIFSDFEKLVKVAIPEGQHPSTGLNKITAYYQGLAANGIEIPDFVHAMLIVAALPPSFDRLSAFLAGKKKVSDVKVEEIRQVVISTYEARHAKGKRPARPEVAAKITAIKTKKDMPSFKSQTKVSVQQDDKPKGDGNSRPQRFQRGKGKGKGKKGKHTAHAAEEEDNNFASVAAEEVRPSGIKTLAQRLADQPKTIANDHAEAQRICSRQGITPSGEGYALALATARQGRIERIERLRSSVEVTRPAQPEQAFVAAIATAAVPPPRVRNVAAKTADKRPLQERIRDVLPKSRNTGTFRDHAETTDPTPGFWDAEDWVYRCSRKGCLYEIVDGKCTKCAQAYSPAYVPSARVHEGMPPSSSDDERTTRCTDVKCRSKVVDDVCRGCGQVYAYDDDPYAILEAMATPEPEPSSSRKRKDSPVSEPVASGSSKEPTTKRSRSDDGYGTELSLGTGSGLDGSMVVGPEGLDSLADLDFDAVMSEYVTPLYDHALVADIRTDSAKRLRRNHSPVAESDVNDSLDSHNFTCIHRKDTAACSYCKGKGRTQGHRTPWLLDSGASKHFTSNLNDFVAYKAWDPSDHRVLNTATSKSKIVGEGTCIIQVPDIHGHYRAVRIEGVRYVPDLSMRLLSLGVFLQEGMVIKGREGKLILEQHNKPFMVFEPRSEGDTLYGVNSEEFTEEVAQAVSTVDSVTYDTMHQRFAHPSDEVLRNAQKHTSGFPDVVFHHSGICRGCAQGKLANRHYAPNSVRAQRPLEVIHSDLKIYPIESYHKHRYVMTFFDDYTSFAWIQLLKKKSDAVTAARQFIQMVKTQFSATIKQWKCDQGTEYLNSTFETILKDNGILLIPSPPYAHEVNGRAERFMRTMSDKANAMRHNAGIPDS